SLVSSGWRVRCAVSYPLTIALRKKTGGGWATRAQGFRKIGTLFSARSRFQRTPWPMYSELTSGNGYFSKTCRRIARVFANVVRTGASGPSGRRDGKYQPAANVF